MSILKCLLPLLWILVALTCEGRAAHATDASPTTSFPTTIEPTPRTEINSGISGCMAGTFGNMPAFSPPPTECLRVLDSDGKKLIAKGVCSGVFGAFRVPLAPGRYVIVFGTPSVTEHGTGLTESFRRAVEIRPGQWVVIAPPAPPNPVP